MIKTFLPIILLITSGILFLTFIDPRYKEAQVVAAEVKEYDDALTRSNELLKLRDGLIERESAISEDDRDRLEYLLPDTVDNIRLVIDIDTIASRYGMVIKDLRISAAPSSPNDSTEAIKSVLFEFSVTADYERLLALLRDLQDSLRVVDIEKIDFSVSDKSSVNQYRIAIRTYWLR